MTDIIVFEQYHTILLLFLSIVWTIVWCGFFQQNIVWLAQSIAPLPFLINSRRRVVNNNLQLINPIYWNNTLKTMLSNNRHHDIYSIINFIINLNLLNLSTNILEYEYLFRINIWLITRLICVSYIYLYIYLL